VSFRAHKRWAPLLGFDSQRLENSNEGVTDEGLSPDLLRGRDKSIGGDLDVDDEGSEQNFKPMQSLHHCFIGYQSVLHELNSPRRFISTSAIENTSKNEEDAI
jgi:hypothetical protein